MNGMSDTDQHYRALLTRLAGLRRRAVLLELIAGLTLAGILGLGLLWLWVGLEALFYLDPPARAGAGAIAVLGTAAALAFHLARRLPGLLSRRLFSLRVERACPELGQRLISALELWTRPQALQLYSPALLAATVADADTALQQIDRRAVLDTRPLVRQLRYLGLTAAFVGLTVGLSDSLSAALHRCAHPLTAYTRQPRTRIAVQPGDQEIVKGEDAIARIRFSGESPRTARILQRETADAPWLEEELIVDRADSLVHTFKAVKRSFSFQARAADGQSPIHRIAVIDPPSVRRLRLEYRYPAYSELPVRLEEESGDIHTLTGTVVDFEIVASKPLAAAALVVDDTLKIPARVEASRAFVRLRVEHSGHYHVELADRKGVANRDPIRYAIEAVADESPQVAISDPGRDMDLPENMQVLLAIDAADDFGIRALSLIHRVNTDPETRQPLTFTAGREVNLAYVWDLSATDLLPEDRVHYRVEALDNDQVSGPKIGTSREYMLRFPSLYELYEEATQAQEEQLGDLEELAQEGHQTGEYLEQVRRELLQKEELSWEQKKELEATLGREAERAKEVEELAQELQQTLEQLEENGLSSEEILEKIAEIRELMSEVITAELREALDALQQALEAEDPQQLAEALRQFNEDQQAFQERLDRTISLLEQVRAEQRLEAAVQQAADLEERQAQINQELEEGSDSDRLSSQEGSLQRDTERLQQELEALSQAMQPFSEQTAEELAAQAAAMEQQDFSGRMQEMIQQMQAQATSQARRKGAGLEQDLGSLANAMLQMQQEFVSEQKQQLAGDIQRAMRDLLGLSRRQEELRHVADERQQLPAPLAEEQFALMQGVARVTEQISGVGRKTMALENPLVPTLGYALLSMQEAAAHLGQQDIPRAHQPQTAAMGHLNEAVLLLMQSLENLAQSRMPSSFGEAMQKMLGLSEQQAQLNQATQQALAQGQQPGRQGMRQQMSRLSAQQRRIFEALEELRRAARGHRGAQQRIGAIEEEMQKVMTDLQSRRLGQRTLQAQERILQRMLDASRSLHTRGVDEDRRRSETGLDRAYAGPAWLPDDLGQSYDLLREAMRHALEGPYPDEYRALIRRYYEQLFQDARGQEEVEQP